MHRRHDCGDDPSSVHSVDGEVAIEGEHRGTIRLLGKANETSIGKCHRKIRVAPHKPFDCSVLVRQAEGWHYEAAVHQAHNRPNASWLPAQQKTSFSEHGFTGQQR